MCKAHSYDDFMRCPRSAAPVAPEGPRIPPVESAMATPEVPRTVHRTRRLPLLGAAAGASFGEGPIAGFRSIIVAGVRHDDSTAAVQDEDGAPRDRSAFKLGSLVEIEGGRVELRLGALATAVVARIVLGRSLLGPVGPVDTDAATGPSRTVLGQTVLVTAGMVFDGSIPGGPAGSPSAAFWRCRRCTPRPGSASPPRGSSASRRRRPPTCATASASWTPRP